MNLIRRKGSETVNGDRRDHLHGRNRGRARHSPNGYRRPSLGSGKAGNRAVDNNAALAELLQLAARLLPGLQGQLAQPAQLGQTERSEHTDRSEQTVIIQGSDNRQQLRALYQYWRQQHPEATHAYWWVRCWNMLIWQPVYLSVIGVHSAGIAVSLARFSQQYHQGVVAGFTLAPQCGQLIPTSSAIRRSAAELSAFCQQMLAELAQVIPLRPVLAQRLLADSLLSALLLCYQQASLMTQPQLLHWRQLWLDALGIDNAAPFYIDALTRQPAFKRRACCMHYLRADGDCCDNCPKRANQYRKIREPDWG